MPATSYCVSELACRVSAVTVYLYFRLHSDTTELVNYLWPTIYTRSSTTQATSLCFRISMPRLSLCGHSLSSFAFSRDRAHQLLVADNLHILLDGNYHELNATNDSFMLLAGLTHLHRLMTQSMYIVTRSARKHPYNAFHADLNENDDDLNWLNDDEIFV